MKLIMVLAFTLAHSLAFAQGSNSEVIRIIGIDYQKQPCYLEIVSWESLPGKPQEWWTLKLQVRTNFQLEGHPPIEVKASHTPWTLFGAREDNYDRIAVSLATTAPGVPVTEKSIQSYNFQTWDEERKLVQTGCRFY